MPQRLRTRRLVASRHRSSGIVLLVVLLALALGALSTMVAADVWAIERRRAQEEELLYVGHQYRLAIQRYYIGAPQGTRRTLPSDLEDLLDDKRFPMPKHHLRRLYPDPITGKAEWGQVLAGGKIAGVYSLSEQSPLKQAGFTPADRSFAGKTSYRDWVFAAPVNARLTTTTPAPADGAASAATPFSPRTPGSENRSPS